jgi:hypothetical protein
MHEDTCHTSNPRLINSDYRYRNTEVRAGQEIKTPESPHSPRG